MATTTPPTPLPTAPLHNAQFEGAAPTVPRSPPTPGPVAPIGNSVVAPVSPAPVQPRHQREDTPFSSHPVQLREPPSTELAVAPTVVPTPSPTPSPPSLSAIPPTNVDQSNILYWTQPTLPMLPISSSPTMMCLSVGHDC